MINTKLQILLFLMSLGTFFYVIRKIKKQDAGISDFTLWILWSFLLLIFSLFPWLAFWTSSFLSFQTPANFIYVIIIGFLYLALFMLSIKVSKLELKIRELVQEIALKEKREK